MTVPECWTVCGFKTATTWIHAKLIHLEFSLATISLFQVSPELEAQKGLANTFALNCISEFFQ